MSLGHPFGVWDPVLYQNHNGPHYHPHPHHPHPHHPHPPHPHHPQDIQQMTRPFAPLLVADLIESTNEYQLHVDLPGVRKEDLDITVNDASLTLRAHRKEVHNVDSDTVHRSERSYGAVSRTVPIPKNADASSISAKLEDGVLTITMTKIADSNPGRKIEIL